MASGSGWNLLVWLLRVIVRRYIDFLILLIPTPLVSVLFCSSSPTFCLFKKCFSFLFQYFFVITFYVLNNFFTQYKPIRATTGVPRQPYEGSTYCFIHEEAHTNVRTLHILRWTSAVWAGCRSRSRGRVLYRDTSRAGRLRTGPITQ